MNESADCTWRGQEGGVLLALGMVVLGLATFAAMLGFVTLCDRVQVGTMTLLSSLLAVAAFVYLVYAMLRPEKF